MHHGHRRWLSHITMPCYPCDIATDIGIVKQCHRILQVDPGIIVREELRVEMSLSERWTQIVFDKLCFFFRRKRHTSIAWWRIKRLVLRRDCVDWNSLLLVCLNKFNKVASQRTVRCRQKRSGLAVRNSEYRLIGFHPGWRTPRIRHIAQIGMYLLRLPQQRNDVGYIVINREVL